jgi:hypothetical protein
VNNRAPTIAKVLIVFIPTMVLAIAVAESQDRSIVVRVAEGVHVGVAPLASAQVAPDGALCVPGEAEVMVPIGQDVSCLGGHIASARVVKHDAYPRYRGGATASVLRVLCVCPEDGGPNE